VRLGGRQIYIGRSVEAKSKRMELKKGEFGRIRNPRNKMKKPKVSRGWSGGFGKKGGRKLGKKGLGGGDQGGLQPNVRPKPFPGMAATGCGSICS